MYTMRQLKIKKQVTNRETISLDKYLHDISKEALITAEEETELAILIRKGDKSALEKLTKANLRFVVSVSKQYQNQGLNLSDLINEGNIGLIKAAQRFDETRGFKFISYAVWWIRQSIMQAIAEHSRIVRLPLNKIGSITRINKTFSSLEQVYEREASVSEVAELLKISEKDVKESLSISGRHISVDTPISADEDTTTMKDLLTQKDNFFNPDKRLMMESLRNDLERSLSTISFREASVLRMYFGMNAKIPLSLEEIGGKLDLSRERVRQIKEKALKKMKQTSRNKLLKTYLG
jgi:RNA polymerase primary sigma factor